MALRALLVFALIAAVETVHGILHVRLLNRRIGDRRARQVGVVTGSGLILLVAVATAPWLAVRSAREALLVGTAWMVLMLAFEVGLGRLAFRASWSRIAAEFNPRRGGWLGLGFLVLGATPGSPPSGAACSEAASLTPVAALVRSSPRTPRARPFSSLASPPTTRASSGNRPGTGP